MKGYIKDGKSLPPCGTCKYRSNPTRREPCYSCVGTEDLDKPNHETEFPYYEPLEE